MENHEKELVTIEAIKELVTIEATCLLFFIFAIAFCFFYQTERIFDEIDQGTQKVLQQCRNR